jgi:hypothetical protein
MNIGEIIDLTRSTILDDEVPPYSWKDNELIHYLNIIIEELYRETFLVEDRITTALTRLKLLSNQGVYSLDERVINIKPGARLLTHLNQNHGVLTRYSQAYMDQMGIGWNEVTGETPYLYLPDCGRSQLYIYPKFDDTGEVIGSSDTTFAVTVNTITKAGEDFTKHFSIGDEINVSGTVGNNGYFTLSQVTATVLTVTGALVAEASTSAILRKVYDTLVMVVNRLPLAPFTVSDIVADPVVSPEIKAMYHRHLPKGIGREAFLKNDTATFNPKASADNGAAWEIFKLQVIKDLSFLNRSERQTTSGIWKGRGYGFQ